MLLSHKRALTCLNLQYALLNTFSVYLNTLLNTFERSSRTEFVSLSGFSYYSMADATRAAAFCLLFLSA